VTWLTVPFATGFMEKVTNHARGACVDSPTADHRVLGLRWEKGGSGFSVRAEVGMGYCCALTWALTSRVRNHEIRAYYGQYPYHQHNEDIHIGSFICIII
jgi:hypothetical protein